jgi:hypothetical protein
MNDMFVDDMFVANMFVADMLVADIFCGRRVCGCQHALLLDFCGSKLRGRMWLTFVAWAHRVCASPALASVKG